ncbi:2010_t:CDS:2 [Diversispora eburnea]|uniref:2010_t:CDS:1 n=1 Tax=Diversispora eburnea TaxID=1213867 RepID=A0A9N9B8K9_9GLOM|nr:2010_t:CDS:2 [Diversispora eburnea]
MKQSQHACQTEILFLAQKPYSYGYGYSHIAHPKIYKSPSELFKRDEKDTCPCTVATSSFCGPIVWGEVVFAQDECGKTIATGLFSDGLVDPEKNCYDYLIVDKCGKVLYNLTEAISPKYRKDGTWPFSSGRLSDLNLDCDKDGVLLAYCDNCTDTKYHKRQGSGSSLQIQQNGQDYAAADLNQKIKPWRLIDYQIKVLKDFSGTLLAELSEAEIESLLKTKTKIPIDTEKIREFEKFELSNKDEFIEIFINKGLFKVFSRIILYTFWASENSILFNSTIGYPGPDPRMNSRRFTDNLSKFPIYDFIQVPPEGLELQFDVVVVGSGVGGGVAAAQLSKAGELTLAQLGPISKFYEQGGMLSNVAGNIRLLAGSTFGGGTAINGAVSFKRRMASEGLEHFTSKEFDNSMDAVTERMGVSTKAIVHDEKNKVLIEEKQGSLMTWLKDARDSGAKFVQDWVETIVGSDERKLIVYSKKVIVSCGSLHSPALLKRSGLQNKNVGKNLFLHPEMCISGTFPDKEIKPYYGTIITSYSDIYSDLPLEAGLNHKQRILQLNHQVPLIIVGRDSYSGSIDVDDDGNQEYIIPLVIMIQEGVIAAVNILVAAGAKSIEVDLSEFDEFVPDPLQDPKLKSFFKNIRKIITKNCYIGSGHQMGT